MRTIAYVDGYNLYHGRLKYTPFKWLDLVGLMMRCPMPANRYCCVLMIPTWDLPWSSSATTVRKSSLVLFCLDRQRCKRGKAKRCKTWLIGPGITSSTQSSRPTSYPIEWRPVESPRTNQPIGDPASQCRRIRARSQSTWTPDLNVCNLRALPVGPPALDCLDTASPSSRGLGHRPFTAVTRVRIPSGTPFPVKSIAYVALYSDLR